jgi:hypothetical protein
MLAKLVKPWPAINIMPKRRRRYGRGGGWYALGMAFYLPIVLSLYMSYYAAYVFWVTAVMCGFVYYMLAKGIFLTVRYIVRKVRK